MRRLAAKFSTLLLETKACSTSASCNPDLKDAHRLGHRFFRKEVFQEQLLPGNMQKPYEILESTAARSQHSNHLVRHPLLQSYSYGSCRGLSTSGQGHISYSMLYNAGTQRQSSSNALNEETLSLRDSLAGMRLI